MNNQAAYSGLSAGALIKQLRETSQPQLSQAELGRRIGRSSAFINLIEHDQRGMSAETARRIITALDLDPTRARALLLAAAVPAPSITEPLAAIITAIMAEDPDNLPIAEFARADLSLMIHAWRRLLQTQLDLRAGHVSEARERLMALENESGLSPLARLYAQRQLIEEARTAGDRAAAEEWLREARDGETLKDVLLTSHYHGELARIGVLIEEGQLALRSGEYRRAHEVFTACATAYRGLTDTLVKERDNDPYQQAPRPAGKAPARQASPTDLTAPIPRLAPDSQAAHAIRNQGLGLMALLLAETYMSLERNDEAQEECIRAERHIAQASESPHTLWMRRRVLELQAWALAREHRYLEAARLHAEAHDRARQAHDTVAEVLNQLYLGDDYLRQITDVIEEVTRSALPRAILSPLGAWREALRLDPTRLAWLEQAEAAYRSVRRAQVTGAHREPAHARSVAHCLRGLATVARLNQRYREARDLLFRAEKYEQARHPSRRLLFIFEERGDLYWDHGFRDLALQQYHLALTAAVEDINAMRENQPASYPINQNVGKVLEARRATLQRKIERIRMTRDDARAAPSVREALDQLRSLVISVIRDSDRVPIARDVDDPIWLDTWLQEQRDLESQPGQRILAQTEFSLSLASELPKHLHTAPTGPSSLGMRKRLFKTRRSAFLKSIEEAHNQEAAERCSVDIYSATWIGKFAAREDVGARAREALRLARERAYGYAIATVPLEMPFAFAVKGRYTLLELPAAFLSGLGIRQPPDQDAPGAATLPGAEAPERRAGYRFDEKRIADQFRELFSELHQAALRERDREATLRWLEDIADLSAPKPTSSL